MRSPVAIVDNEYRIDNLSDSHQGGSSHSLAQDPNKEEEVQLLVHLDEYSNLESGEKHARLSIRDTAFTRAGSIFATTTLGFIIFIFVINSAITQSTHLSNIEQPAIASFRRRESEYTLDATWDSDVLPTTREYNFTITNIIGNPDGVYRPLIAINQQFPGPLIECNEGDVLQINVDNQSSNATSLHFHGIYQNGSNWMDGTSGVTQCPIASGERFQYIFNVTGQSGTHFYHGHQGVQASDGLFGPLVVHPRVDKNTQKIEYASDRVVILQDYYHDSSDELLFRSMRPGAEGAPVPDGALINGRNMRDCSQLNSRLCNNSSVSYSFFELEESAAHRLRFINVGALAYFHVSVDEHDLHVVEADGTDLVPVPVSRLMMAPAQRYSVIFHANHMARSSFWLRARMMTHCWGDNPKLASREASEVKAVVRYTSKTRSSFRVGNAGADLPSSQARDHNLVENCLDMSGSRLVPAIRHPAPSVATHSYYLRSNIEIGDWRLERGYFNSSSFRPNVSSPTLHRILEGMQTRSNSLKQDGINNVFFDERKELVIQHSKTETIDLIIQNFDEGSYPMHLHGHKFWILGSGHGMFPGYAALGLQPEGKGTLPGREDVLDDLIRRDVATLENFGWLAIRVIMDNPGVWAFHCHMAWHSEKGLVMLFVSRTEDMKDWAVPAINMALCDAGLAELEKGTPPKDSMWEGDLTTEGSEEDVIEFE